MNDNCIINDLSNYLNQQTDGTVEIIKEFDDYFLAKFDYKKNNISRCFKIYKDVFQKHKNGKDLIVHLEDETPIYLHSFFYSLKKTTSSLWSLQEKENFVDQKLYAWIKSKFFHNQSIIDINTSFRFHHMIPIQQLHVETNNFVLKIDLLPTEYHSSICDEVIKTPYQTQLIKKENNTILDSFDNYYKFYRIGHRFGEGSKYYSLSLEDFFSFALKNNHHINSYYENPKYIDGNNLLQGNVLSELNEEFIKMSKTRFEEYSPKQQKIGELKIGELIRTLQHNQKTAEELKNTNERIKKLYILFCQNNTDKNNQIMVQDNIKKAESLEKAFNLRLLNQTIEFINYQQKLITERLNIKLEDLLIKG